MAPSNGKIVIVTGVSGTIGNAVATSLVNQGYSVVGLSRGAPTNCSDNFIHIPTDIRDEASINQAIDEISDMPDVLYALINAAGSMTSMAALVMPNAAMTEMVQTNILGTLMISRAVARQLINHRNGRIIFFGSMASILNPMGDATYSITKHATVGMADALGMELAKAGITCNSVIVTATKTGMSEKVNREALEEIIHTLPTRSWTTLSEITRVVEFFLDEASSGITCQKICFGGLRY
jgi:NAD(P)-dependent dehydrogenase (short-subunit alcohol dehydrogenase family)